MGRYIIVTGSPGAGKTAITSGAGPKDLPRKLELVNVGTLMLEEARKLKYTDDRDRIRYMDPKHMGRIRKLAFSKLAKMSGDVVVDTHDYVEENGRFVPGMPERLLLQLGKIEAFIYVDAPEVELLSRRRKDKTRKREIEDPELLGIQRMLNLSALSYYSSAFDIPIYVIENRTGFLNESIKKYASTVKEVLAEKNPKVQKK